MMERSRSSLDIIGILQKRIRELTSDISTLANRDQSIPDWITPDFLGSWINFGVAEDAAGYWRNSAGIVMLKGVVSTGIVPGDIFQLDPGFRPGFKKRFPIVSSGLFAVISVSELGIVRIESGTNAKIELSGIAFRSEK